MPLTGSAPSVKYFIVCCCTRSNNAESERAVDSVLATTGLLFFGTQANNKKAKAAIGISLIIVVFLVKNFVFIVTGKRTQRARRNTKDTKRIQVKRKFINQCFYKYGVVK